MKHGKALAQRVPDFKIPSHRVSNRTVACPECGADLGEPCVSKTGKPVQACHASRRRMATRLDNENRS